MELSSARNEGERRRPRRPRGVLELGWACFESSLNGRTEHRPTAADYPESQVRRISFQAGGGLGWRISALSTPRPRPAPWKIVIVTGAPSWAEYWAPVLAALPEDREMVVVDRPGFAASEPHHCVLDIRLQARALAPLAAASKGQKVLLVGQSYGAAIATLMAAEAPAAVGGVVLLSSYLGRSGPTADWLVKTGARMLSLIPRDLRHAVMEIRDQPAQLPHMQAALKRLTVPVHLVHGEADDFAPIETARSLAGSLPTRLKAKFHAVPGANHFLNDGPAQVVLDKLEGCIAAAKAPWRWRPAATAAA
jgi:pimeloyl-ACP methyl ester carboxylesterase